MQSSGRITRHKNWKKDERPTHHNSERQISNRATEQTPYKKRAKTEEEWKKNNAIARSRQFKHKKKYIREQINKFLNTLDLNQCNEFDDIYTIIEPLRKKLHLSQKQSLHLQEIIWEKKRIAEATTEKIMHPEQMGEAYMEFLASIET